MKDRANEDFINNIGCAFFPAELAEAITGEVGWAYSINPFLNNKIVSWLYLQWSTNKEISLAK